MNFHEVFSKQAFFEDFVTFDNFAGFIVVREHIDNIPNSERLEEEKTYKFYAFLLRLLRGEDSPVVPKLNQLIFINVTLFDLVLERLEYLRSSDNLVEYVHPSFIDEVLSTSEDELEELNATSFHADSLVGQFLRKFVIGFHLMTFDQMIKFRDAFYDYYDAVRNQMDTSDASLFGHLSTNQVAKFSESIIKKVGQLGSMCPAQYDHLIESLRTFQKTHPDLATPHFTSHLIAMRQRNFTQAEAELYKAFEMVISGPVKDSTLAAICDPKPSEAWTGMTLAAVDMHHRLGHEHQARSFQRQALNQALETNDTVCLRQAKAAHDVLNSLGEPFRYETADTSTKGHVSTDLLLTELRCKLLKLLGTGASPQRILLTFFNSAVATQSEVLAIVLLDVAFVFAFYGHSILATTLLQCVVMIDCLRPCSISDEVLAMAISQLARAFAVSGSPAQAVRMLEEGASTIGQFDELSIFERARVETQLEQALRIGSDLNYCSRLVSNLALFCPWESNLRRACVELKRGNQPLAFHLLQIIAGTAEGLRTSIDFSDTLCSGRRGGADAVDAEEVSSSLPLLSHLPPTGGVAALVRFEVRARIAMADAFACINVFHEAIDQLERACTLSRRYHMNLFTDIATVMLAAVSHLARASGIAAVADDNLVHSEVFTSLFHQAEPSVRMHLTNLKFWLSLVTDNCTSQESWKAHLRESAVFFANIGDRGSLQKTVDIFVS
ncbi:unnamed protein product [Mesocestoides corti]|uniref:Anaphase-promoting complex subunit 5 n=1 Tax=Mesocestoides corti TaxID=53468 RepID=A0A0R3U7S4_MESCO|nr:unnamed protein product [Mesocestoides corti]